MISFRIKTGSPEAIDFFNALASGQKDSVVPGGLKKADKLGIEPDDFGWFVDNLQSATVTNISEQGGEEQRFQLSFPKLRNSTPDYVSKMLDASVELH